MDSKNDLHAKWICVEYEDGYIGTPSNLQKGLDLGILKLTPCPKTKWDIQANFSGSGWANGCIVATAGKLKMILN